MQRFRPVLVLVVEDSPDDLEIAARALGESRVATEFMVATDGRQALDLLFAFDADATSAPRPDLVLLDIKLPKVNGLEVLEKIREDGPLAHVPVLMLSASGREEDVVESYRLGANSYIQKPAAFDRLREMLAVAGEYWLEVATLPPSC